MKKKILTSLVSMGAVSVPILTALSCGQKDQAIKYVESTLDLGEKNKKEQIFAISDAGDFNDGSFNQQTGDAVDEFIGGENPENKKTPNTASASDISSTMNDVIKNGAKVVLASGFLHIEPLNEVTPKNPGVAFVLVDGEIKAKKDNEEEMVVQGNVLNWIFNMKQPSFLAGYKAAEYASKNKGEEGKAIVSTFGGMDIPSVTSFMDGFKEGVKYWNKENKEAKVEIYNDQSPFIGNFEEDKDGAITTKTETLIEKGVDVILPVGGPQVVPVLNAVASDNKHVRVIGVDTKLSENKKVDNNKKKFILGSIVKEIQKSLVESLEAIYGEEGKSINGKTGKDVLGQTQVGNLENGLASFWNYDGGDSSIEKTQKLIEEAEKLKL